MLSHREKLQHDLFESLLKKATDVASFTTAIEKGKTLPNLKKELLASAYFNRGKLHSAIPNQARQAESDFSEAIQLDAKLKDSVENFKHSLKIENISEKNANTCITTYQTIAKKYFFAGLDHYSNQEYTVALSFYTQATQAFNMIPNDTSELHAEAYHYLGLIYEIKGELNTAHTYFLKSIELQIRLYNPTLSSELISAATKLTYDAIEQKIPLKQIELFNDLAKICPNLTTLALVYRGASYRILNLFDEAFREFTTAGLRNHQDALLSFLNMASMNMQLEQYENAKQNFKLFCRFFDPFRTPGVPPESIILGLAVCEKKLFISSNIPKDSSENHRKLGELHLTQNPELAAQHFTLAITEEGNPVATELYVKRADAYVKTANFALALDDYNTALCLLSLTLPSNLNATIRTFFSMYYIKRAHAHAHLGNIDKSIEDREVAFSFLAKITLSIENAGIYLKRNTIALNQSFINTFNEIADIKFKERNFAESILYLETLLFVLPNMEGPLKTAITKKIRSATERRDNIISPPPAQLSTEQEKPVKKGKRKKTSAAIIATKLVQATPKTVKNNAKKAVGLNFLLAIKEKEARAAEEAAKIIQQAAIDAANQAEIAKRKKNKQAQTKKHAKRVRAKQAAVIAVSSDTTESELKASAPAPSRSSAKVGLPIEATQFFTSLMTDCDADHIYLVGGWVRDSLLKERPDDFDYISHFEIKKLPVSIKQNEYKEDLYNYIDAKNNKHDLFYTSSSMSDANVWISSDALHRDLTINALYANLQGEVFDPTGRGLQDLRDKVINTIDDPDKSFTKDPLRMLRAIHLANKLGFKLSQKINASINKNVKLLLNLNPEIINAYFAKMFSKPCVHLNISMLQTFGIFDLLFPGIDLKTHETWLNCFLQSNKRPLNILYAHFILNCFDQKPNASLSDIVVVINNNTLFKTNFIVKPNREVDPATIEALFNNSKRARSRMIAPNTDQPVVLFNPHKMWQPKYTTTQPEKTLLPSPAYGRKNLYFSG